MYKCAIRSTAVRWLWYRHRGGAATGGPKVGSATWPGGPQVGAGEVLRHRETFSGGGFAIRSSAEHAAALDHEPGVQGLEGGLDPIHASRPQGLYRLHTTQVATVGSEPFAGALA